MSMRKNKIKYVDIRLNAKKSLKRAHMHRKYWNAV